MKCNHCGAEIKEGEKFCTNCGQKVETQTQTLQSNNLNQQNNQRRKSNVGLIVGLIVGVVVLGIISIVSVILVIVSKEVKQTNDIIKQENSEQVESPGSSENSNNQNTPTTIDFNNYKFTVPSDCKASVSNNQLIIYGPNNKWVGVIMTQAGNYDTLVSMKDQIKTALSNQEGAEKYDLTNAVTEEKTYGGMSFLITKNIISESYNLDISYGKADDNNVFVVSLTNSNSSSLTETERIKMYSIAASGHKIA